MNKRFLTIKETCKYTGFGETKLREIVRKRDCTFALKVGNKYFIDKEKFDTYLDRCMKYQIGI